MRWLYLCRQEEEMSDEERNEQDPAAAATAEGPEATARATNHDGPALGDPNNRFFWTAVIAAQSE